jgi:hypothetical protein
MVSISWGMIWLMEHESGQKYTRQVPFSCPRMTGSKVSPVQLATNRRQGRQDKAEATTMKRCQFG